MTTKHDVIRVHREHPEWTARQIADDLDCSREYVSATARRNGLTLTFGREPKDPNSIYRLGRAARRAGLTVEDIELIAENM
jgi:hypothetical protein